MDTKRALITGITGQDGSYLAELLLENGYEVHGIVRRQSVDNGQYKNIENIKDSINIHYGDLLDHTGIFNIVKEVMPDELYNLAAQSHVGQSSKIPIVTSQINGISVVVLLEAIKQIKPKCKFYQASTSEMFGSVIDEDGFQRETTQMKPSSPYGCAKLFAHNMCNHYRTAYNMFVSSSILYNHESRRRGKDFVTQKIVKGAIDIANGKSDSLILGNLEARRDWGHAKDYVEGMYLIMQHEIPEDFVLATGETYSVEDFCSIVFNKLGLNYRKYIEISPEFYRPQDVQYLKGDASKAKNILGWKPKYDLDSIIDDMLGCSYV